MKRYILFSFDQFYPIGGLRDIKDSFDTLEEVKLAKAKCREDFQEIVDRDTWEYINFDAVEGGPL
jgi:hypothetical protein